MREKRFPCSNPSHLPEPSRFMNKSQHIIAVIDLFDSTEEVTRVSRSMVYRDSTAVRFVALFDHLRDSSHSSAEHLSSEERFRKCEMELLQQLKDHLRKKGMPEAECFVLTGPPAEELGQMARQWGADLILTDQHTARTIYNSWTPFFQALTPLPCRIQVVTPEIKIWFHSFMKRLFWFSRSLVNRQ